MPGRDHSKILDMMGWLSVLSVGLGVVLHGSLRILAGILRKKKKIEE